MLRHVDMRPDEPEFLHGVEIALQGFDVGPRIGVAINILAGQQIVRGEKRPAIAW